MGKNILTKRGRTITHREYIIRQKLNIVELGEKLGTIGDARRKPGISRQHYYDIKKAIDEEDLEGLPVKSRSVPRVANRVAPEMDIGMIASLSSYPFSWKKNR
ncbi:MAG: hypothetical protein JW984_06190 [Deltaproteobacteria bacterium]|uniref:Uncharacterized protein n=1 Tax=Candidatus Zymogenus saltonus TaxID=2844893 RepID=A0A9D8KES9_9DELT|nr:hypothetical protein [Candidatus Zymogenus saltonus]